MVICMSNGFLNIPNADLLLNCDSDDDHPHGMCVNQLNDSS